jgi:glycosyltransferase involved in cell wall biosynthesis
MNVLLVSYMEPGAPCGVRTYYQLLQVGLESQGHTTRLVTPSCAPVPIRWITGGLRRLLGGGNGYAHLVATERKNWWRIRAAVRSLDWHPDIVHAQDPGSASAVRMALGVRVPVVTTCHFSEDLTDEALNQAGLPQQAAHILRRWHGWTFGQTWHWIAVSRYAEDVLRRHLPVGAPVRVIHNGVDFEALAAIKPVPFLFPNPKGLVRVLNVGSLEPRKNQEMILDVADRLRDRPVEFILAGDGPDRDKLTQDVRRRGLNGIVRFLGYRQDIPAVMRSCDIYLHVAMKENCPFVVLEAIAAGLPVMALASGGIPELLEATTEEALVIGSSPAAAIDKGLSIWIRQAEIRAAIARRQYDFARPRFSLFHARTKIEDVYREIIHGAV